MNDSTCTKFLPNISVVELSYKNLRSTEFELFLVKQIYKKEVRIFSEENEYCRFTIKHEEFIFA